MNQSYTIVIQDIHYLLTSNEQTEDNTSLHCNNRCLFSGDEHVNPSRFPPKSDGHDVLGSCRKGGTI
jgi:hypothetical protein